MGRGMPAGRPTQNELCPDAGAGDGNRTHATSLEGWDSTIELHPRATDIIITNVRRIVKYFLKNN